MNESKIRTIGKIFAIVGCCGLLAGLVTALIWIIVSGAPLFVSFFVFGVGCLLTAYFISEIYL